MSLAIDELVQYLKDLAGINSLQNKQMMSAVNSQFKEIKNVITGCNLSLENIDEESIRASIETNSKMAMNRTESNMFGPSSHILTL